MRGLSAAELVSLYGLIPAYVYAYAAVTEAIRASDGSYEGARAVLLERYTA